MDQQTERIVRNAVRIKTAPLYIVFWLIPLSILGVAGIAFVAELAHWMRGGQ